MIFFFLKCEITQLFQGSFFLKDILMFNLGGIIFKDFYKSASFLKFSLGSIRISFVPFNSLSLLRTANMARGEF